MGTRQAQAQAQINILRNLIQMAVRTLQTLRDIILVVFRVLRCIECPCITLKYKNLSLKS